jgi:5,10-methylenetetrahydromethanopterin reductase
MEIGVHIIAGPGRTADTARFVEDLGFATLLFPDSQNLQPDVWGQLMVAARATSRVRLGPGVTNSVTRDAAVTASAALGLHVESGGRAILGIGRGDSAVQRIGKREDRVASFAAYVAAVRAYLDGTPVDRDGTPSRLEWLPHVASARLPRLPIEVAATGRRVIEVGARHADAVCFAVGAAPEYVSAALAHARQVARDAGRDPTAVRYGAFVNAAVHEDAGVARDMVRGAVATFARFSAFAGSDRSAQPPPLRAVTGWLRTQYDMAAHARAGAAHVAGIPDAFVDWFAVAGPVDVVRERFRTLARLGLDFCHVIPGAVGVDRALVTASLRRLAADVVPAVA